MNSDEKLDEIIRRMGLLETGDQNLGTRLESLERESGSVKQGIINLGTRLESVENKAEVIESTLKGELRAQIGAMAQNFTARTNEIMDSIQLLGRKIDVMNKELLSVKADQGRLEDRFDDLEKKPA